MLTMMCVGRGFDSPRLHQMPGLITRSAKSQSDWGASDGADRFRQRMDSDADDPIGACRKQRKTK